MASPSFVPERGEIWYSDGLSGFYAVRLTGGRPRGRQGAGGRRCLARRSRSAAQHRPRAARLPARGCGRCRAARPDHRPSFRYCVKGSSARHPRNRGGRGGHALPGNGGLYRANPRSIRADRRAGVEGEVLRGGVAAAAPPGGCRESSRGRGRPASGYGRPRPWRSSPSASRRAACAAGTCVLWRTGFMVADGQDVGAARWNIRNMCASLQSPMPTAVSCSMTSLVRELVEPLELELAVLHVLCEVAGNDFVRQRAGRAICPDPLQVAGAAWARVRRTARASAVDRSRRLRGQLLSDDGSQQCM